MEWIRAFMGAAAPHLGTYALFMFLTGCRPSEGINVQWDDVDLQAQTVLLRETKGGTERTAHLPTTLVVAMANLPRIKGRGVFVYQNIHAFQHAWENAIERAGIKYLTPHCCRHGFATELLRRGVDVLTVAWLGGWKDAAQVLRTYGHANKNRKLTDLLIDTPLTQETPANAESAYKTGTF
jgi:integrase